MAYQTPPGTGKRWSPAMTIPAKFILGLAALLLGAFIAYHWYVGATILGVLLDSVCMVFPVCPKT
jgi:hypothetical protein